MTLKLKTLFRQKSFDRVFTRQLDDMSCGPACLTTIARLYSLPAELDMQFFKAVAKTGFAGTLHEDIRPVVRKYLPVTKSGVGTYDGGIAFVNIRHKPEGDSHFVVFLAKKQETIIYYDPFDHKIYRDHVRNMQLGGSKVWRGGSAWTASMPRIAGADFSFWDKHAMDNPYKLRDQIFWLKEHGHRRFPV